jgi:hypothetical protein
MMADQQKVAAIKDIVNATEAQNGRFAWAVSETVGVLDRYNKLVDAIISIREVAYHD